jgi:hypothetical protein
VFLVQYCHGQSGQAAWTVAANPSSIVAAIAMRVIIVSFSCCR